MGFTLDDIAEYLDLYDAEPAQSQQMQHILKKVDASIANLNQKMVDLQSTLDELKAIRARLKATTRKQ